MGSLGRLVLVLAEQGSFLKNHAHKKLHPNRRGGVPSGAAAFIVQGVLGDQTPSL
jgi:hypothetical protein